MIVISVGVVWFRVLCLSLIGVTLSVYAGGKNDKADSIGSVKPADAEKSKEYEVLANDVQPTVQRKLSIISSNEGGEEALKELQALSYRTGYLKPGAHSGNPIKEVNLGGYGLCFRCQTNLLRSLYVPEKFQTTKPTSSHCPICWEQVASASKPGLRAFEIELNGNEWFLQVPPFPYAQQHFALIEKRHERRMRVRESSLRDGIAFLEQFPGYTFCSNSDFFWSSCSIPKHHHYQVFRGRLDTEDLPPLLMAEPMENTLVKDKGVEKNLLHYPLPVARFESSDPDELIRQCWGVIQRWRAMRIGRNSVNILMREKEGKHSIWVIFRSTDFRNPEELNWLKRETLGYMEAAGEFIIPKLQQQDMTSKLESDACEIFSTLLEAINPLLGKEEQVLMPLLENYEPTALESRRLGIMEKEIEKVAPGEELPASAVKLYWRKRVQTRSRKRYRG